MADNADQVLALFDSKARSWPEKYAPDGALADRLARMTGLARRHTWPGGTVLDLGCGTGELARALSAEGLRVSAADISAAMLRLATAADPGNDIAWQRLDPGWQVLPFPARAFDTVIAASVLEYVHDPANVLTECARVLRLGGVLLLTVPDVRHPVRWAEWLARPVARLPLGDAPSGTAPRLRSHLVYLRTSQHRHSLRWWRGTAQQAGLSCDALPTGQRRITTLRVVFCRSLPDRQL
jgi:SAM-dependent methyltransferase